jgi:protein disulfide-isomerase A1
MLMSRLALPVVSDLTADTFDSFVKSFDVLTVLVGSKGSEQDNFFSKFAEENTEQFVFARVSDAAVIKKAELPESGIVVLKNFDEKKVVYKGAQENDALVQFLKGESFPLLGEVRPENYPNYVDRLLPIGLVGVTSDDDRKKASEAILPVAKELKGKISFAFIDATKFGEYLNSLGAKGTYPNLIIQEPHKNTKFVFEEIKTLTVDAVRSFSNNVLTGKVASFIKSAEPPVDNSGPLKIVVGNTYKDIVLNPENDVFIAFTATWCGHCKNLAPIWEQLATVVKDVKGVVIAKMDAAENDLPQDSPFQIQGFPTIKLVKAKTNEIVSYEGDRKLESFLSFLKSNAANGSAITDDHVASADSSDEDAHDEL